MRGAAFSHVLGDIWITVLEVGQDGPVNGGGITVPCDSVNVLSSSVQDILWEGWNIYIILVVSLFSLGSKMGVKHTRVVVISPNRSVQSCIGKGWANVALDQISLLIIKHVHCRIVAWLFKGSFWMVIASMFAPKASYA